MAQENINHKWGKHQTTEDYSQLLKPNGICLVDFEIIRDH